MAYKAGLERPVVAMLTLPLRVAYKIGIEWVCGCELPPSTDVGAGLRIFHGQGLVVHPRTVIGRNVTLRHNTTIGAIAVGAERLAPVICDRVDVGANATVLGGVRIGTGAVVGAGSVVVSDVPDGATVVGNPARLVEGVDHVGGPAH
ncbi:MAG: serine acetyltransferase [Armatimonadota bacterium]